MRVGAGGEGHDVPHIRPMADADADAVLAIYADGIATGHATFESSAPGWADWDRRHLSHSRLVADALGEVAGFAALSPVSSRAVYAGVAEVSLYVGGRFRGTGLGRRLLRALVESSEANGCWTLQASIFPENAASVALHAEAGFREMGVRRRIAKMRHGPQAGRWRDTVIMERRSATVGVD